MTSLINKLNTSNILNIVKDFRVKNPKIFIAIVVIAMTGPMMISIKIVIDTIETIMVGVKLQCNPSSLLRVPKKEYEELRSYMSKNYRYLLDYPCKEGFQGNRFFEKGYDIKSYFQAKALIDPKFNPDSSKKLNNIMHVKKEDILIEEIKNKGFTTPRVKDSIIFDKLELKDMMEKKAKEIYSDEGELFITCESDLETIKENINKAVKEGKKIKGSDCYTILGNINYNFYLAIHKTNMSLYADKTKTKPKAK